MVFTLADVAKHNSASSCWLVIHEKVYDVTDFQHPGGTKILLEYAGTDATGAYESVHALSLLEQTGLQPIGTLDSTSIAALRATKTATTAKARAVPEKPPLSSLISAYDIEKVANQIATPKTWAFFSSAATDCITHTRLNREIFDRIIFRPRILRDVKKVSIKTRILGLETKAPFFIAPAAMAKMMHPDGELALCKGAGTEGIIQCVSTNSSFPLEDVIAAAGPKQTQFLQLYVNRDRSKTAAILQMAKASGIMKAVMLTVDAPTIGKREADERVLVETPVKSAVSGAVSHNDKKGGGMGRLMGLYIDPTVNWSDIAWIKEQSGGLPLVLKGLQNAADVKMAAEYGVQGVVLSNHGGRGLDTSPPGLLTLLEVHRTCPEVLDRLEIYVDGGIRRGTDIFKALCLGATAVGVGRPYLYALGYGAEGVAHLTQILKDELKTTMRLCGITDLTQVHPGLVNTGDVDHLVPQGEAHPYIKWKPRARI